ncbi:gigaxonin-like [Physella acuta]|uniref:gigaxonin-like n=1 Tax=Physella acuta TaxID=109671 RepID=UPI0027DD8CD3|nr:gigaxonin-like [Physella acuta]
MVKSTLACGLQECLSKEWMGDNFSDFRVVVDDSEYFCHKFILSACSTFFKGLLRTNFKENLEQRVELNDMSKETFEVIINAIYKGVDGLTLDNIISVWQATHMLDVPFLIEECERFVVENMSLENYITYYDMAKLLHSETVINFTIGFMAKKFEHFRETETFLELSFPILFTIVADDCLNVKSEDLVLESIIKWVSYIKRKPEEMENIDHRDSETVENSLPTTQIDQNNVVPVCQNTNNDTLSLPQFRNCEMSNSATNSDNETLDRKKCLTELLSTARTFLASRSYLDKLLIHPLIMSCVEALEIVHNALLYQWRSVSFPSNFVIPYRNCSGKRNVMAFVKNEKLHLFELNSQSEVEMNLQLKCDTNLASTESTLCFSHSITGTRTIAIIDSTKTITNIYKKKHPDVDTCLLKSVPGVFERIRVVVLETQSNVVPLVVPDSWITQNEK